MVDWNIINLLLSYFDKFLDDKWYVFAISIPLTLSIIFFEAIYMGWNNSALKRMVINPSASAKTDLIFCILNMTNLYTLLSILFSFGLATFIPLEIKKMFGFNIINSINNPIIEFMIVLLIYDFLWYWRHRVDHKIKCFWVLHKYHHSSTEFNITTAHRLHPFGSALWRIITCLPFAVAGISLGSYVAFNIFKNLLESFKHSNLPFRWGLIGRYLLISPISHKIHHSTIPEHLNKNFGVITPIWDHIFGTWYDGQLVNEEVDVLNNPYNQKMWYFELWYSYKLFWKECFNSLKKIIWLHRVNAKSLNKTNLIK